MKRGIKKIKEKISLKFKIRPFFTHARKEATGVSPWSFTQDFFKNSVVHWLLLALTILIAINWIIPVIFISRNELYSIILHYNVYLGVDLIGEWWRIYLVPAIGTFIVLLNSFLAWRFYARKERIASYILLIAALMVQLSSAVAIASVILINR